MTLQEKMNVAENVDEDSSEEENDSPQKASVADKLALRQPGNESKPINTFEQDTAASNSQKKFLTFGDLEQLPEDQEIVDEEDVWDLMWHSI